MALKSHHDLHFCDCCVPFNQVQHRADFQQGMESVSQFKMNTVTKTYWLIYAAAMVTTLSRGILFSVTELI